jgi:hypothetical protein
MVLVLKAENDRLTEEEDGKADADKYKRQQRGVEKPQFKQDGGRKMALALKEWEDLMSLATMAKLLDIPPASSHMEIWNSHVGTLPLHGGHHLGGLAFFLCYC